MKLSRGMQLLGVAVILLLLGVFALRMLYRLPSDQQMRSFFADHRDAFVSLKSMLGEDRAVRRIWQGQFAIHRLNDKVSDLMPRPASESGLSPAKIEAYDKLTSELKAWNIRSDDDGSVTLINGGWGFAGYGPRWGYVWLPLPPSQEKTLASLDDFVKKGPYRPSVTRYIPLEDHWFIVIHWGY